MTSDSITDLLTAGWGLTLEPVTQSRADLGMLTASGMQAYFVFEVRALAERGDGTRIVGNGRSLSGPAGAIISAIADVSEKVNAWARFEIDRFSMRPFERQESE